MDLAERRAADRDLARRRHEARFDFVRYEQQAADADLEYRKTRARVYMEQRAKGNTATGSELVADAAAADARHKRDVAKSLAKAALLRIEETEREATVVRDIHRSSERVEGLAA